MPRYTFEHSETGERKIFEMKIAEFEAFKGEHPEWRRVWETTPLFIERRKLMGGLKTDAVFSSRLREIHKNTYGSTINAPNVSEV